MQEPVPKGIVVVDKDHRQTADKIAMAAGVPTTSVLPDPVHILKKLEGMVDTSVEIVGANTPDLDKLLHGEGPQTGIKTVAGSRWLNSLKERAAGKLKIWK